MGVEELKELMREIKSRGDNEHDIKVDAILQLIEAKLSEGMNQTSSLKK
ncbi:hypothetical protein [Evansella halocellulosilytica]|nr:hypothetical protein [Evansella halocellulosilytica]